MVKLGMIIALESIQNTVDIFLEHHWTHIESSRHFFVQAFCISTFHYGYWIMTDSLGKNNQVTVKVVFKKYSPPIAVLQGSGFGIRAQKMRILCIYYELFLYQ